MAAWRFGLASDLPVLSGPVEQRGSSPGRRTSPVVQDAGLIFDSRCSGLSWS